MKVQVNVEVSSREVDAELDITVSPSETVACVKERISTLHLIPFPDQDLLFDGQVLEDSMQLSSCGVSDLATLVLVVRATEACLVKQISELLQARDLSCDELGLLYCYKHGVSANQALKLLGRTDKLQDFVRQQKQFLLENNNVALVREDTKLRPFSVASEVEQILKATGTGSMEIKELCAKFSAKFNVSLSSILGGIKPSEFLAKEKTLFVLAGRGVVSLASARPCQEAQSCTGPGLADGVEGRAPALLSEMEDEAADEPFDSADTKQYTDLHNKISGRTFSSKASQALVEIVDALSSAVFLQADHIVKGGSIGKGVAISGVTDAEVVFFLPGLPHGGHERWMQPLLKAVAGTLNESLGSRPGYKGIHATEDSVQMCVRGIIQVDLRFSPVFNTYAQVVQLLGEQGPEARRLFAASLVEERVQFISRQPGTVKATIRLMKWWRDQQDWSSNLVRPKDEVLELITVYSAIQTKPGDQRKAVANVMSLLSRFDELRIVWSNYYSKGDVWAPLLRQRPLLMDPVNPFVNIADPQAFDARELMALAQTTHFFW